MADSKKYNGSTLEHSLRKLTTATESVGNLIYSNGQPLLDWRISGNTVQNSTPTPPNSVFVQGVGERTANLLNAFTPSGTARTTVTSLSNGGIELSISNATWTQCKYTNIPVVANVEYTLSIYIDEYSGTGTFMIPFRQIDGNGTVISTDTITQTGTITHRFTAEGSTVWLGVYLNNSGTAATASAKIRIMLNTGSTAKPYEPYGYKIPISSGGVTTNIYLGSTQTTRRIKKLVLDGTENITSGHLDASLFNIPVTGYLRDLSATIVACTHYKAQKNVSGWLEPQPNVCTFYAGTAQSNIMYIRDTRYTTIEEFKAYLAAQYAAGTPVTVWYVLATAETAAANEPLHKIGTYADTLSNAAQIPTTEGANNIAVNTTVQPSEFTATWTGWHNANVKEWDGQNWT